MENELNITILQSDLVWESAPKNRENFETKINSITVPTDVIVLPEMFTTGFAMQPEHLAESMDGPTIKWMLQLAKAKNSAICGSIIIKENEHYYNRFIFVTPSGEIHQYNKRHLFSLAGEHKRYQNDNKQVIIEYKGWKICPLICYDLRFPVWSRNTSNYDVLLYVANWPKPRVTAWNTLLKARAIENMSYVVGANRMGTDANGHQYSGNSIILDALGNEITPLAENKEAILTASLSKKELLASRNKFNFLNDQDGFEMK
ncbi:MAG: amidohydrolase [Kordia sp.]|nr:MAG: amidohydrolase [Kordia sp.]